MEKLILNAYDIRINVEIIAKDFKGNATASINIPVQGVPSNSNALFKQKDSTAYKIIGSRVSTNMRLENITVAFPKNTRFIKIVLLISQ